MAELTPAPQGYPIKLVRDRTPMIVNATGKPGELWYGSAPREDVVRGLRLKLAEEVGEYLVDGGEQELADIMAVVEALAGHAHGLPLSGLLDTVRDDPRGGFLAGVMMYGRHAEFDR